MNQLLRDPRIQIIIVEWGDHPRIKDLDIRGHYKFVHSDVFNLGWLYNVGFRLSKTDHLFFGDNGYVPRLDVIHNIMKNLDPSRHCVYLQNQMVRLTREQTDGYKINDMYPAEINIEGPSYYTREGFMSMGLFEENVFEDWFVKLQDIKNKACINIGQIQGAVSFKLDVDKKETKEDLLEYSEKHFNRISGLDKPKIRNYCKAQMKKNGLFNKYRKLELMNP